MHTTTVAARRPSVPSSQPVERVWDLGVRAFHWSLAAAVLLALASGLASSPRLADAHVIAGTVAAALIVFRLVWGFTGGTYARFKSFIYAPATTLSALKDLLTNRHREFLGHNPLGAIMVFGLLLVLTGLVVTGGLALGGVFKEGPMAPLLSFASGRTAREVHELLAYLLIGMIALHVTGVIVESRRSHQNLARAMVTGCKHSAHDAVTAPFVKARPLMAGVLTAGLLAPSALAIAHFSAEPVPGVPAAALDPVYAKECGTCHSAHHPSLAAAATWDRIIAGLEDHFGENASLDAASTSALAGYLRENAAQHWDTAAANLLVPPSAVEPLRITATAGWKRIHREIPGTTFERTKVGGRLNCSSCHSDAASGLFKPRAIAIPEETTTP